MDGVCETPSVVTQTLFQSSFMGPQPRARSSSLWSCPVSPEGEEAAVSSPHLKLSPCVLHASSHTVCMRTESRGHPATSSGTWLGRHVLEYSDGLKCQVEDIKRQEEEELSQPAIV